MTKIIEIKCCKECPNFREGTFYDYCELLPTKINEAINKVSAKEAFPKNCPLKDKQ